jgi:hypothetical protein
MWLCSPKIMKTSRVLVTGAGALLAIAVSSCAHPTGNGNVQPAVASATASVAAPATTSTPTPAATVAGAVQVSLTTYFNDQGIYPDGAQFSGGIDKDGFGCSSNVLGTIQTWGGVSFQLGSAINSSNVITCQGQTVALPPGNFSKLEMLAIAVNGAQADQAFNVTYTDNSNQSFTQSLSDWAQPDSNTGESQAVAMDYRDQADGSKDENTYNIYGYSFDLKSTKTVQSLKLPDNDNIKVFALTLVP